MNREQRFTDHDLIVIEEQSKSECDEIKQIALKDTPRLISELRQAWEDKASWRAVAQFRDELIQQSQSRERVLIEMLKIYGYQGYDGGLKAREILDTIVENNCFPDERKQAALWFAERMNVKLQENVNKGGWSNCNPCWLLDRLKEEVAELEEAMGNDDGEEIIREAADVGNFAMMIADIAERRK